MYTVLSRNESEKFFESFKSLKGKDDDKIVNFFKKEINVDVHIEKTKDEEARIAKLLTNISNYSKEDESERSIRLEKWEKGWLEIFSRFKKSLKYTDLVPSYVQEPVLRIHKRFAIAEGNPKIEIILANRLLQSLFYKFFSNVEGVVELGCGTAKNLILLRKIFSNHVLFGADWSKHSMDIIDLINKEKSENLNGIQLNMLTLEGVENLPKLKNKAILSVNSFEQLGIKWKPILHFLLSSNPKIVVHVEPIEDFYQKDSLFDLSALVYHQKRKYLKSFFSTLQDFENQKKINIVFQERLYFGSERHEGYSVIAWEKNI